MVFFSFKSQGQVYITWLKACFSVFQEGEMVLWISNNGEREVFGNLSPYQPQSLSVSEYIFYGLDNSEQLLEINSVIVQEWIPVDLIY